MSSKHLPNIVKLHQRHRQKRTNLVCSGAGAPPARSIRPWEPQRSRLSLQSGPTPSSTSPNSGQIHAPDTSFVPSATGAALPTNSGRTNRPLRQQQFHRRRGPPEPARSPTEFAAAAPAALLPDARLPPTCPSPLGRVVLLH